MIYGLSTMRNCFRVGYPFAESLLSIYPMVDHLIVIDGGSTDGTESILDALAIEYPKFEIIRRKDEGHKEYECIDKHLQWALDTKIPQGSWVIHSQADELFHEKDVPTLVAMMRWCEWNGYFSIRQRRYDYMWVDEPPDGYSYRIIRIFRNINIVSKWGGDDFRTAGLSTPAPGYTSHNIPPELEVNVPFYHFPNLYPKLMVDRQLRHINHLAEGAEDRLQIYEKYKSMPTMDKPRKKVRSELPTIIKELDRDEYVIRSGLFNRELMNQFTCLNYG